MAPDHEEPRKKGGWHLDKTVSLTHLFSTVAAIATLIVLGAQFDKRLTLVEQSMIILRDTDMRHEKEAADFKLEIRDVAVKINDKLDRLIEGRSGQLRTGDLAVGRNR
jgi:hypothetical protein